MKKLKKIVIRILLALLISVGVIVGLVILTINIGEEVPVASSYEIDLELVRGLAESPVDALPARINNVLIAQADFMHGQVIVGGGLQPMCLTFRRSNWSMGTAVR